MKSTDARTIIGLSNFLEGLCDLPSHLAEKELNRQRVIVLKLALRGWRKVAGQTSDDPEQLAKDLGEGATTLVNNLKQSVGRPLGRNAKDKEEKDKLILAEIAAGSTYETAIRKYYQHGYDGHLSRIKKARREHRRIVALQTPIEGRKITQD